MESFGGSSRHDPMAMKRFLGLFEVVRFFGTVFGENQRKIMGKTGSLFMATFGKHIA